MRFKNREEAAGLMAKRLAKFQKERPLVLGIPRGAVVMAKEIAERLEGDLDVVLAHKLGAPGDPEYAIGSVSEFGAIFKRDAVEFFEIPESYLESEAQSELEKLKKRRAQYSPIHPPIDPQDRTVIIVDDGIATGATMLAAISAVRSRSPKRVIVAAPVASPSAAEILRLAADETVFLDTPTPFYSISQFYDDFSQVTDEDVIEALSVRPRPWHRQAA